MDALGGLTLAEADLLHCLEPVLVCVSLRNLLEVDDDRGRDSQGQADQDPGEDHPSVQAVEQVVDVIPSRHLHVGELEPGLEVVFKAHVLTIRPLQVVVEPGDVHCRQPGRQVVDDHEGRGVDGVLGVEGKTELGQVLGLVAVSGNGDLTSVLLGRRVDQGLVVPELGCFTGHLSVVMAADEDHRVGGLVGHVF